MDYKMTLLQNSDDTHDIFIEFEEKNADSAYDFIKNHSPDQQKIVSEIIKNLPNNVVVKNIRVTISGREAATLPFSKLLPNPKNNILYAQPAPERNVALGYLYGGSDKEQIYYAERASGLINTVSPDYFNISPDGNLYLNEISEDFINAMKNKGIKITPFLSNHWNRETGINALNNIENISRDIAENIEIYNFDGVNVDIENVTQDEKEKYVLLAEALREQLPRNKEVSVAVAANPYGWSTGWHGSYDYEQLARTSNYLLLMSYDEHWHGGSPGPVASIGFVEDSVRYALKYVPAEKIALGLPFFGRMWSDNGNFSGNGLNLKTIDKLIDKYSARVIYDFQKQSPKAEFTVSVNNDPDSISGMEITPGNYVIWYENEKSLQEKRKLISKYALNGLGIWKLGNEPDLFWQNYDDSQKSAYASSAKVVSAMAAAPPANNYPRQYKAPAQLKSAPIPSQSKRVSQRNNRPKAAALSDESTGTIISPVNFRIGPSTKHRVITTLKAGDSITVVDLARNGWLKATLSGGETGYLSANYVSVNSLERSSFVPNLASVRFPSNLRTGASTKSRSVAKLKPGDNVTALSKTSNGWYRIRLTNGKTGYIEGNRINILPLKPDYSTGFQPAALKTAETTLNIRSLPSSTGKRLGILPKNKQATLHGHYGRYSKITYNNITGYVLKDRIR